MRPQREARSKRTRAWGALIRLAFVKDGLHLVGDKLSGLEKSWRLIECRAVPRTDRPAAERLERRQHQTYTKNCNSIHACHVIGCSDKNRAVRGSRHRFLSALRAETLPTPASKSGVARNTACRRTPNSFVTLAVMPPPSSNHRSSHARRGRVRPPRQRFANSQRGDIKTSGLAL